MTTPPLAVRLATAIFSRAVLLLPGRVRVSFGDDIRDVFLDDAVAAYRAGGIRAVARTTVAALADLCFPPSTIATPPRSPLMPGIQELRHAVRALRRQPGFFFAAVAMLALGIGGNVAVFTVVNAVLLRPLPYADADRLVRIWGADLERGDTRDPVVNPNDAADWLRDSPALESLGVATTSLQPLSGSGDPEMVPVAFVTPGYFDTLGVGAARGRLFSAAHAAAGHQTEVVVTDGFWRRVLGGNPAAVGTTIRLSDVACTIIGVLPPSFVSPGMRAAAEPQVWRPLIVDPANRGGHYVGAIARLRPGATIAAAQQQVDASAERLSQQFPATNRGKRGRIEPLQRAIAGDSGSAVTLLMAAVIITLLIACANVANLLLARASTRQREFALRRALGASRWRVVRQILLEGAVLAGTATLAGTALGWFALGTVPSWLADQMPAVFSMTMDARVLAFTAVAAVLTVLLFATVPALTASRHDVRGALNAGAPGGGGGTRGFQTSLVVIQAALAVVLLAVSTTFAQSLSRLTSVDPGFTTHEALTFRLALPRTRYATAEQRNAFHHQLVERLAAQPGVVAAGGTNTSPLSGRNSCDSFGLGDRPAPPEGQEPCAEYKVVTPGYFAAMGIPLVGGRLLQESDVAGSQRVALISQSMARRYFAGGNPVGARLKWGSLASETPWLTIVGVVGDVKHFGLELEAPDEIYMPLRQSSASALTYAVKTTASAAAFAATAREIVRAADPALPIAEVLTTRQLVDRSVALPTYRTAVLGGFAALALILSMAGVYSLLSFYVAQRRRELGIRLALGATSAGITGLVLRRGLTAVGAGCVIGLLASIPAISLSRQMLFGVSAADPMAFVTAAAVLVGVGSMASYLPARRATRVDPVQTLRGD